MTFERAVEYILLYEGGFSDDPRDPGGATNWGITHGDLSRWRGHEVSADDVRALPREEALRIYRAHYWNDPRIDELPENLRFAYFNAGINMGVGTAARLLQKAVGAKEDGKIGPLTLARIRDAHLTVLEYFLAECALYYARLHNFGIYGKGWLRRLMNVALTAGAADPARQP